LFSPLPLQFYTESKHSMYLNRARTYFHEGEFYIEEF